MGEKQLGINEIALKLEELNQIYLISIELLKKTHDPDELLNSLLDEYKRRFREIPGTKLVADLDAYTDPKHREKVRALLLFAELAAVLKENADMQSSLRNKNKELKALARRQEKANKELQELNRHYLNMLSFVSHELRSPLISILGFAELLEEGFLGEMNVEQLNSVQIITRVTRSLIDMIRNYLDLAKMENGELLMSWEYFNVHEEILQPLFKELEGQLAMKSMQITPKAPEVANNICLQGDSELLKVVFTNLFSNAIKYGRSETQILYTALDLGNSYYFSVYNEGRGVARNKLKSIFKKFTQGIHNDPDLQRGTGLGLFNTQCIVNAHGGNIWAESEPTKWFKICFILPKNPQKKTAHVTIPAFSEASLRFLETENVQEESLNS